MAQNNDDCTAFNRTCNNTGQAMLIVERGQCKHHSSDNSKNTNKNNIIDSY